MADPQTPYLDDAEVFTAFIAAVERLERQAARWGLAVEANGLRNYRTAIVYNRSEKIKARVEQGKDRV